MQTIKFSLIIPIFNRPNEAEEILASLAEQDDNDFEIVLVEDGSTLRCDTVAEKYSNKLNIKYHYKDNSGPGDSRNFGCRVATGNYFIILDSDCIIPPFYISSVRKNLAENYVDAWGGPDSAHESFTLLQKGINYSMTSIFTTGGIRGGSEKLSKFQPRSFNMGISKEVFEKTGGFGTVHPGEDPDLTFRIWKAGYKTTLFSNVPVFHKRRIDWGKFSKQMYKFGVVRVFLNKWHPGSGKITYWFPLAFSSGLIFSFAIAYWFPWLLLFYAFYLTLIFIDATAKAKCIRVAAFAIIAVFIQFFSYGWGFLKSQYNINMLGKEPEKAFPGFFFKLKK